MKKSLKILLGTLLALTITNCSLFGGGSSDGQDAYDDADSAYGDQDASAAAEKETEEATPDVYVSPDTFGDADASDKEDLNLDSEGYGGGDEKNAQADVSFGENEGAPDNDMPAASPAPMRETSAVGFKQGMYDFGEDCQMRQDPTANGSPAGMVRAGKKLWVEPVDNNWLRVYKKSGPVYISRDCVQ